jgi:hypothetical protein
MWRGRVFPDHDIVVALYNVEASYTCSDFFFAIAIIDHRRLVIG